MYRVYRNVLDKIKLTVNMQNPAKMLFFSNCYIVVTGPNEASPNFPPTYIFKI